MRHVDAKIKILLVLFYCYNFTFVSIMNCDRQKFSIVTLHESKVHYANVTRIIIIFYVPYTIAIYIIYIFYIAKWLEEELITEAVNTSLKFNIKDSRPILVIIFCRK